MSAVPYVLGVDAGNSKTIALLSRLDGTIVGAGRAGCGDIYGAASAEDALAAVDAAIRCALRRAGAAPDQLSAAAFSMAGADWPEDVAYLHAALQERGYGHTVTVVNDAIGALRAGSPDGTGVVIACGTGAAIAARAPDGRTWHNSHWQEPQGAEHLGYKTLRAVYRVELGIEPPTTLTARVLATYALPDVAAVLHRFTAREGSPPRDVGRLARVLLDEAAGGDPTARRIVVEHGAGLGDYALVAARRAGIDGTPFMLVLSGGVFRHPSRLLAEAIVARVHTTSPQARPVESRFEPAAGALFLALEAAGLSIDEPLLQRLMPTIPPPALFAT